MIEWSETDLMVRDAVRAFIDKEVRPNVDALESGEITPYPIIRKLFSQFGLDVLAAEAVKKMLDRERARRESGEPASSGGGGLGAAGEQVSMGAIVISELAGVSLGTVAAMTVSLGLGAATIASRGTLEQKERWLPPLVTMEKVAAWAITEPDSGSDAFGGMKTYVRRDGDDYILNGQKTFITNGPYADTVVVYAKLDDGSVADKRDRPVLTFVLDAGMPGFAQGKPFKKMGMHASPTGELFFDDVRLGPDRLLSGGQERRGGIDTAGGQEAATGESTQPEGRSAATVGTVRVRASRANAWALRCCPSASSTSATDCVSTMPRVARCGGRASAISS